jgi:hypothetical protein
MADSSSGLGTKVVTLYVGPEYEEFVVHRNPLCAQSVVFAEAYKLPSDDLLEFLQRTFGRETSINQANGGICLTPPLLFRPRDMEILVEYLYTGSLPAQMEMKDLPC